MNKRGKIKNLDKRTVLSFILKIYSLWNIFDGIVNKRIFSFVLGLVLFFICFTDDELTKNHKDYANSTDKLSKKTTIIVAIIAFVVGYYVF